MPEGEKNGIMEKNKGDCIMKKLINVILLILFWPLALLLAIFKLK